MDDEHYKNNVLKCIADKYARVIISFAMEKPQSVIDIVIGCNIPISIVYRRVHELEKTGILVIHGSIITNEGKKYNLYKSNIKAVRVVFGMESLDVEIIPNNNMEKSAYW